jgi:pimeloyl-ACP methyl ester carboxylesterase
MPLIDTANGKIFFADHRDPTIHRTPVVMIHGAGASHLDWPAELRRMPEANAILPDLPGHYKSPKPGRQNVSSYAADIVALLDALKLKQAFIAGHSMGGAIALTMALHYPNRVKGLILIGTGAKLSVSPEILNNARSNLPQVAALITSWEWGEAVDEQIRRLGHRRLLENDPEVLYNDYAACNAFDVRDQLSRITAPTLIVGGTADRMTPFKFSAYLNEHIAGSKLVTIQGGGHKMMLEQPEAVADAVQSWLMEVEK